MQMSFRSSLPTAPLLLICTGLLWACGSSEEPAQVVPPNEPADEVAPPAAAAYEVHEWGLLDVVQRDGSFEVAAGPGEPAAVPAPPGVRPPAATRKPVLYFHLAGTVPVTFSASVSLTGSIAEHWPSAELSASGVRWDAVTAAPGACTSGAYPSRDSPECANAPGGYCELADLRGYETSDGACLTYKGQTWDHLFYRGAGTNVTLPIRVESTLGARHVVNTGIENAEVAAYYLSRGPVGATTPVRAQRVALAAVGESAQFPSLDNSIVPAIRTELSGLLRAGGLTDAEATAFEQAWYPELFENSSTGGAPVVRESVLFVLPESLVEGVTRLSFEPAPTRVRRVMVVRIDLAAAN